MVTHVTKVEFQLEKASDLDIEIYDLAGKKVSVLANKENFEAGIHRLDLDKNMLSDGLYLVKMRTENGTFSTKIMITE